MQAYSDPVTEYQHEHHRDPCKTNQEEDEEEDCPESLKFV